MECYHNKFYWNVTILSMTCIVMHPHHLPSVREKPTSDKVRI